MTKLVRSTFAGKNKVYDLTVAETHSFFAYSCKGNLKHAVLAHNCHELSRSAMDAMLKPLEDNIRGTEDRQLVCIFCTTEPKKLRGAIKSRCAPSFKIRTNTPEEIASRLEHICQLEGFEYEKDMLPVIAEACECHFRDSIKAIEGVSMLGSIDRENVERYLHLDANVLYLDLLENVGVNLSRALETVLKLVDQVSPATVYERMAEICMMAYRLVHVGQATIPSYWDRERLRQVGDLHKEFLVEFAHRFAERPAHPSEAMLMCDVSALHQKRSGIVVVAAKTEIAVYTPVETPVPTRPSPTMTGVSEVPQSNPPVERIEIPTPIEPLPNIPAEKSLGTEKTRSDSGIIPSESFVNPVGVHINPQAQHMSRGTSPRQPSGVFGSMSTISFTEVLQRRVIELTEEKSISGRSARRDDVGSS